MRTTGTRHSGALAAILITGFSLLAHVPAASHVEGQVLEAPAGDLTELSFRVLHGCGNSPTVEVAMQVPDGATDVAPSAAEGWVATVVVDGVGAADAVVWSGGPLPSDERADFALEVRLQGSPGDVLHFPFVQTCEEGELAWIEIPEPGGPTPAYPAPAVVLVAGSGATTTTNTAAPPTEVTTPTTLGSAPVDPTTTVPSVTTPPETQAGTAEVPPADDGSEGGPTWVILAVAGLSAVLGVALARRWWGR